MSKTTITVGQSVQVFNMGQPERWNKFSIVREFDNEVNELEAIDEIVKLIEAAHEKHSQSVIFPQVPPSRDITFFNVTTQKEER
jgi:hypothetical protein